MNTMKTGALMVALTLLFVFIGEILGGRHGMVNALARGKAQAVVYDYPLLRYQLKKDPNEALHLVGRVFEKQGYGIALPIGSPYRKQINAIILELGENGFIEGPVKSSICCKSGWAWRYPQAAIFS